MKVLTSNLFLWQLHNVNHHQSVDYLRAVVQLKWAILKLRTVLRSIHSKCVFCRKRRAQTVTPLMSDLPTERFSHQSPVSWNTGVDCFGSFHVSIHMSTETMVFPVWLFDNTRNLHRYCTFNWFEFMYDGNRKVHRSFFGPITELTISALKRICFQQWPLGTWTHPPCCFKKGIKWKFNPPASPRPGGSWERLVRSCKQVFYAIRGNHWVTDEVLNTTRSCREKLYARSLPLAQTPTNLTRWHRTTSY